MTIKDDIGAEGYAKYQQRLAAKKAGTQTNPTNTAIPKPDIGGGDWINTRPTRATVLSGEKPIEKLPPTATPTVATPAATPATPAPTATPAPATPAAPSVFDMNESQLRDYVNKTTQEQIQPALDIYHQTYGGLENDYNARIAQLEAQKGTVMQPYQDLAQQQQLQNQEMYDAAAAQKAQEASRAVEDTSRRFGMQGFGRSTIHSDEQYILQQQAQNIQQELTRAKLLENSRINAELMGATQEQLGSLDDQIMAQKEKVAGLKSSLADSEANLKLKALESGKSSLSSMMEQKNKQQSQLMDNFKYLTENFGSSAFQNMGDAELKQFSSALGVSPQTLKTIGQTLKEQQADWDKLKYATDLQWEQDKFTMGLGWEQDKFYDGQAFDMQKLAEQNGFDWQKMQASQQFDVEKMLLGDELEVAKEYRNNANAASYGDYAGNASASNGNALTYNTPVPHPLGNTPVVAVNPKLAQAYPEGFKFKASDGAGGLGGQCAYVAEQLTKLGGKSWTIGNTIGEKKNRLSQYVNNGQAFYPGQQPIQVGQTILTNDSKQWGHVAVVNAITPDGKLVLTESNFAAPLTMSNTRTVSPNDPRIFGVLKTDVNKEFKVQAGNVAKQAVKTFDPRNLPGNLASLIRNSTVGIGRDALLNDTPTPEQVSPERQAVRDGSFTLPDSQLSALRQYNPQGYQQYLEDLNYSKQGGGTGEKLPANQVVMLEDAKFLPSVLDKLEQTIKNPNVSFDPVSGFTRGLNPFDTTQKTAEAEIRTAAQLIGKFMEGGVLRVEDEIKYKNMLPNSTDTREVAQAKLNQVRQMLKDKMSGYVSGFGGQGYNVSAYNNPFPEQTQVPISTGSYSSSDPLGLGI